MFTFRRLGEKAVSPGCTKSQQTLLTSWQDSSFLGEEGRCRTSSQCDPQDAQRPLREPTRPMSSCPRYRSGRALVPQRGGSSDPGQPGAFPPTAHTAPQRSAPRVPHSRPHRSASPLPRSPGPYLGRSGPRSARPGPHSPRGTCATAAPPRRGGVTTPT